MERMVLHHQKHDRQVTPAECGNETSEEEEHLIPLSR